MEDYVCRLSSLDWVTNRRVVTFVPDPQVKTLRKKSIIIFHNNLLIYDDSGKQIHFVFSGEHY